ncbi:hypothetical protein [Rhizobium mongolense]|uniref:Uncharacterized protein n=1 Tax=Rhizobium mongolense TaxID=57676 RepID=A0A7W6RR25_9HYPH|nr:hypothetical protein [Rhizobium mongolense]MBB4277062.1 hypothetical protein [Rhizobium mongolense]
MAENVKDTARALSATKAIIDGRDPVENFAAILVTAEHAIATVLLACMADPRKAAAMLNEGLVQGVEQRLSYYASKGGR